MLVEFTFKNFRSFKDEATLSLEAESLRSEANKSRLINTPNKRRLLPSVGIFGANASGKSNVILALMTLLLSIRESSLDNPPTKAGLLQPFALDDSSSKKPALMQVVFWDQSKQVEYRYGFLIDRDRVLEEWLYVRAKANVRFIDNQAFIRSKHKFEFGKSFKPAFKGLEKSIRSEDLALPHLAKNNYRSADDFIKFISEQTAVLRVFESRIKQDAVEIYESDRDVSDKVKEIIKKSDLSIQDLSIETQAYDPQNISKDFLDEMVAQGASGDRPFWARRVVTRHKKHGGKPGYIDFNLAIQESIGTERLFNLAIFVAWRLKEGGVLVIDEIDMSLHPLLVAAIVNQFDNKKTNPKGAQLIYNSNQPYLLSKRVGLRRDQIWFTEKNKREESSLHSLSEYEVHGYEISKNYLVGRFGAIPILGFDRPEEREDGK